MIVLYREANSLQADAIEAEFRELVLGYERVVIEPSKARELFGGEHALPIIQNNQRVVSGEETRGYLKELAKLAREWRMFEGDYCYVDEDGGNC
jgi:hypothetical protein